MAHKKAGGSSRNGRDSPGQRRDHTLFALQAGAVQFRRGIGGRQFISVVAREDAPANDRLAEDRPAEAAE
jgi:ribosomal protein L27